MALMQPDAHLHENKSRTEACLRLPSDCRPRMAFMVPAVVVTQATVLCNAEPTLFECGPSRTACLPACAWHEDTEWQLHHLLMMITGNMNEREKKKAHSQRCTVSLRFSPSLSFYFRIEMTSEPQMERNRRAHILSKWNKPAMNESVLAFSGWNAVVAVRLKGI